ncbi:lytic murein transglycosylase [Mesobaculum littorinae]|uniref:Lytic murein transglycosylase n=1 Tax=Mesobaculum littorinae TaxID=2486419 RepID=A0A438AFG3_9RHOB|nr:lytic murein transglycosylase [Mesobaculum littorinae]RVV97412.1 lytic murein transglycosylase [Mesobaculum littorinae]
MTRPTLTLAALTLGAATTALTPAAWAQQDATAAETDAQPPLAVQCGGDFASFKAAAEEAAVAQGADPAAAARFFDGIRRDPEVIAADRRQGVFQLPFIDFSRRLISQARIDRGQAMSDKWDDVFTAIERDYGVSRGVLLAFWAFETDYGAVQGDFNTANALVTLAHDCRRPELFLPQVFAAIELSQQGGMDPDTTTGAWAGEIGMVQMLPEDILDNGVDADGNGTVELKTSAPDALTSGAAMLRDLGWRAGEPWLEEVEVPDDLDWSRTGLDTTLPVADWEAMGVTPRDGDWDGADLSASLLLPQGRKGPAFVAYPNFIVYFEWNQSFVYVATAAYFATRLEGAPVYDAGNPDPGLGEAQMIRLQEALQARGYDVGGADGILGEMTREAVQAEQEKLGLPADAWPTPALLDRM